MAIHSPIEDTFLRIQVACWEALRSMAKRQTPEHYWSTCSLRNDQYGLYGRTLRELEAEGIALNSLSDQPDRGKHRVWTIVLESYGAAIAAGIIVPHLRLDGSALNPVDTWFQFSRHGFEVLRGNNEPNAFVAGDMRRVLTEATRQGNPVSNAAITLLDEAQRCVMAHCYRAAVILIGLATEDQAVSLCETTRRMVPQPRNTEVLKAWKQLTDDKCNFSQQWKALLHVLEALKKAAGRQTRWSATLETVPWAIGGLGEAIRLARNQAAYEADRVFSNAETVLLLKSVPAQLQALAAIDSMFNETGIVIPAL